MKRLSSKARVEAFTLIEVLVVLAIIAIVAFLMLPRLTSVNPLKYAAACSNNQREIAMGLTIFREDNSGQYPWQVAATNGGAMESITDGHPASQFRVLREYKPQPYYYICRTDPAKQISTNQTTFSDQNISYFVNVDAKTDKSSILTGDRHLESKRQPVKPGLFTYSDGNSMNWTWELHKKITSMEDAPSPNGVLSFADGHVERVLGTNLTSVFQRQFSATNRLAVP